MAGVINTNALCANSQHHGTAGQKLIANQQEQTGAEAPTAGAVTMNAPHAPKPSHGTVILKVNVLVLVHIGAEALIMVGAMHMNALRAPNPNPGTAGVKGTVRVLVPNGAIRGARNQCMNAQYSLQVVWPLLRWFPRAVQR